MGISWKRPWQRLQGRNTNNPATSVAEQIATLTTYAIFWRKAPQQSMAVGIRCTQRYSTTQSRTTTRNQQSRTQEIGGRTKADNDSRDSRHTHTYWNKFSVIPVAAFPQRVACHIAYTIG